ncbi:MAG TPA: hypothetical protein VK530_06945, partial [Candidatus Acidoferrum sp.]|nr:hypothetical protein [Candidatus Acidoferrum sp.]
FDDLAVKIGTSAQIIAHGFTSIIGGAISSIADGISGLIEGTLTWGQALQQVGTGIVKSIIQSFSQMVAEWFVTHVVMQGISWAFKSAVSAIRGLDTAEHAAHTATQVGVHTTGEGAKTGATLFGTVARGALRLGETIFHGIQVAIRVAAHIAGEVAMTAVTIIQSVIRIGKVLFETMVWLVQAAIKGANSVASIPYVGPILAIAAMGAIIAAGVAAMGGFAEGGYVSGPGDGKSDSIPARLSNGEFVVNSEAVKGFRPVLEGINAGEFPNLDALAINLGRARHARVSAPITSSAQSVDAHAPGLAGSAGAGSSSPSVSVSPTPVQVVVVKSAEEFREFMESNTGKRIVVKHVRNDRGGAGLET